MRREGERRRESRRTSDRVLVKILEILKVVERMSRGERVDFTETYADLVGLKDRLGRRREDRELGEALCAIIGAIACSVADTDAQAARPQRRRVRLTRLGGGKGEQLRVIEGWEEEEPQEGKSYRILQDNGRLVRTSTLTRVSGEFLQSRNSLYKIQVLMVGSRSGIKLPPRGDVTEGS